MQGATAKRLVENKAKIMTLWAERAKREVDSATTITALTLADSLPVFLDHLAEGLAINRKADFRSLAKHEAEAVRLGKLHGADRAGSPDYLLSEVVFEYHILRQVIFEVLEEKAEAIPRKAHDLILDAIEQAVNDAAVEFTEIHADIQEKFISTLTHDLRSPITAAKINAQMMMRRTESSAANIKSGGQIVANLNRVDSMIKDLLDASRVRAGQALSFEIMDCELDSLIHEIVAEMALTHGDRFIVLSPSKVTGRFGTDALRRAIENLVGNAVKYSLPETPITVSLKNLDNIIQIIVHNEGNPIPEKEQAILFEQYRRAKSAEESSNTGWGLGLTLVKGVVDAHHGSIRVESNAKSGTSFIIELPHGGEPLNKQSVAPFA